MSSCIRCLGAKASLSASYSHWLILFRRFSVAIAGGEESIVWRVAGGPVNAYLNASIPCFALVEAVLPFSSLHLERSCPFCYS